MKERGQVALVILAVMAITFTLGISLSHRVLTDLRISEQEQESSKAFSAAEAGIEEALRRLRVGETTVDIDPGDFGVDSLQVDISVVGGANDFVYPEESINPGETVVVWLRDHTAEGELDETSGYDEDNIDVCWRNNAALEIIYFYKSGAVYAVSRYAFDPDDTGRRDNNHFSDVSDPLAGCAGLDVGANVSWAAGNTPLFLLIRPFYEETQVATSGVQPIPAQGYVVYSTGEIVRDASEKVSRRVRVFRGWSTPPPSLFNTIFSGAGVSGG